MTAVHQLNGRRSAGFTLIEVILAIVIALAILVVVLHFYQQATNLREQVIAETEKVGAARLLMDRITGELRSALPEWSLAPAFIGTAEHDPLRDDGGKYAKLLSAAGVPVQLSNEPTMVHVPARRVMSNAALIVSERPTTSNT